MLYYNPITGDVNTAGGLTYQFGITVSPDVARDYGYYPIVEPEGYSPEYYNILGYLPNGDGTFTPYYVVSPSVPSLTDYTATEVSIVDQQFNVTLGSVTGASTEGVLPLSFTRTLDPGGDNTFSLATEAGSSFTNPSTVTITVDGGPVQSFTPTGIGGTWLYTSNPITGFANQTVEVFVDGTLVATVEIPAWMGFFTTEIKQDGTGSPTTFSAKIPMEALSDSLQLLSDRISALGG
jgi:hypothetical protein